MGYQSRVVLALSQAELSRALVSHLQQADVVVDEHCLQSEAGLNGKPVAS